MNKNKKEKIFYLSLILISLISIVGALVYRFYSLNNSGMIISIVLAFALFILFLFFLKKINYSIVDIEEKYVHEKIKIKKISVILYFFYFLFFALSLFVLYKFRTHESIVSPWEAVPRYFFIFYTLATLALLLIIAKKIKNSVLLIVLHSFLSFSVLWIIFKLGYGYDPFIHQATMELIKEKGEVLPKPFYYLGQYSLVLIIHKITFVPIALLNKLLVPLLAAFYLPITIFIFLKKKFSERPTILLSVLLFLILPFSFFTITTPQNLSYLFLILTIFSGVNTRNKRELTFSYLLALTTLLIHPISGIPALLFIILLTVYRLPYHGIKRIFYGLIFLTTIVILPLLFYLTEKSIPVSNQLTEESGIEIQKEPLINIEVPGEENFILNFIYFFKTNEWLFITILVIISLIYIYKKKKEHPFLKLCFAFFFCLLFSYLLTSQLNFDFLISYEKDNYSKRILATSIMFLLPIFAIIFYKMIERIRKQNNFIQISFLVFFTLLITTSLYGNYPRKDNFFNSHSFSIGENDLEAVRFIEEDSGGKDYIVLANQQVSVAALSEFGFNRYYKNDIYFYPIPTGGPLYNYFLDMVYKKPSYYTAKDAMSLAGVNNSYFVLNKYWWAFDKVLEEAKLEADSFREIADGKIYVFKYIKY